MADSCYISQQWNYLFFLLFHFFLFSQLMTNCFSELSLKFKDFYWLWKHLGSKSFMIVLRFIFNYDQLLVKNPFLYHHFPHSDDLALLLFFFIPAFVYEFICIFPFRPQFWSFVFANNHHRPNELMISY